MDIFCWTEHGYMDIFCWTEYGSWGGLYSLSNFDFWNSNKYDKTLFIIMKMPSDLSIAIAALNQLEDHGGNAGLKIVEKQSGTFYNIYKIPA